jgi:hypothetical protein
MNSARLFPITVALALSTQLASAQDLSRYRVYSLDSSLDSVLTASGARPTDTKLLHERPARIQELEWRAPYVYASSGTELIDPVKTIRFSFYDDALYQLLVSYDPDRTDGLSNSDIVDSLTAVYGTPVPSPARNRPLDAPPNTVVLGQWNSAASSVTLFRGVNSAEFQLLLTAKTLSGQARSAIRDAGRLDLADAPRRELEQRTKAAADATAARDKTRASNKAAFRP